MTVTIAQLSLYAGALLILFLTPGPVWVALIARAISGGFHAAWPLALGVVVGDVLWPLLAIFGVSYLVSIYADFLTILRYFGALVFVVMGVALIRHASVSLATDSRLTKPGMWAGFVAGLLVILGNPKAILFYMGILPGFFDLSAISWPDILAICILSMIVPLLGNLVLAASIDRARRFLASPTAVRRTNVTAGALLILVGIVIALSGGG